MSITDEKLERIRKEYGELAYNQYLNAEKAVEGKDHLSDLDREYIVGQSYEGSNSYTRQQHRHIDQIVKGTEPTQEEINTIADEALKQII